MMINFDMTMTACYTIFLQLETINILINLSNAFN